MLSEQESSPLCELESDDRQTSCAEPLRVVDATGVTVTPDATGEPQGSDGRGTGVRPHGFHAFGPTARKGVLALADQFVVSGANFAVTVIVGRACGANELGVYALAYTFVVLILCAQESLILTPYTVYWHRLSRRDRPGYTGSVLTHYTLLAALVAGCAALCGGGMLAATGWRRIAALMLVLAAVVPVALLRDFVRRLAYAQLRVFTALALDVTVAVLQIGGLIGLAIVGVLSPGSAYVVMGVSGAVAVAGWFLLGRPALTVRREKVLPDLRRNWSFGRWDFAALMTLMLQLSVVPWMLALVLGTHAAGIYAACISIVSLARPVIQGVSNVLVPRAALAFAEGGRLEVRRVAAKTTRLVALAMTLFCGGVMLVGAELVSLLYGGEYADCQAIVAVLALAVLCSALGTAAYDGLRAIERPDVNFKANLLGLATTAVSCSALMVAWGVLGAAAGLLAGYALTAAVRWVVFLRQVGDTPQVVSNA